MNLLAHLYLSGNSDEIRIGNFMGDFIKGKEYQNYPDAVASGIILHRKIDHYTDRHPITLFLKKAFLSTYQHYSGILVDMLYDHFLAKNWEKYSNMSLDLFLKEFYFSTHAHAAIIPERVKHILFRLEKTQRLQSYQTLEGIKEALELMSQHTSLPARTPLAIETIRSNYDLMENLSNDFIRQIGALSTKWISEISLKKVTI